MDMCNIMVSKSFQKESVRFVLHNVTSPIMQDGYEMFHIISFFLGLKEDKKY